MYYSPLASTPNRLYRNISIVFVAITIALIVIAAVFFYSQAVITITTAPQDFNIEAEVEINSDPAPDALLDRDVVAGQLISREKVIEVTVPVTSTTTLSGNGNVGTVTIVNDSDKPQALLKTTQLQAASGVVVRTSEAVTVPAKGKVTVGVYPRDPDTFTPVESGRLTIIKLPVESQSQIYGLVDQRLIGSGQSVVAVTGAEIKRAEEEIIAKGSSELRSEIGIGEGEQLSVNVRDVALVDSKLGDQVSQVKVRGTVVVTAVDIEGDQLQKLLERKVGQNQPAGSSITGIGADNVSYELIQRLSTTTAIVKIKAAAKLNLDTTHELLRPSTLAGQSVQDVINALRQSPLISDVSVRVSPHWRTTLPGSPDRIKIIIQ